MRIAIAASLLAAVTGCSLKKDPKPKGTGSAAGSGSSTAPAAPAATAEAPKAGSGSGVAETIKKLVYPEAKPGDVVEDHFGIKVADPYRWMEDMDSPAVKTWVAANNKIVDTYLAGIPGKDKLHARFMELLSTEGYGLPVHEGKHYFWGYKDGKSSQPFVMMADALDGKQSVLIDANRLSTDGSKAFDGYVVSDDGTKVAYGWADGGGDWQTWKIRDVETNTDLDDELTEIKYYAPQFDHAGTGLYYSRFPKPQPGKELVETDHDNRLYFHRLGTKIADDVVVMEGPANSTEQYWPVASKDGKYLVIMIGDGQVGDRGVEKIAVMDLAKPTAKPAMLVDKYTDEYIFAGNIGTKFLFQTTKDAVRKQVVSIDMNRAIKAVVPEGKNAIDGVDVVGNQVIVNYLEDAHSKLVAYDATGKKLHDVELPGIGAVGGARGDLNEAFFAYASFTNPPAVLRYDGGTGTTATWKQAKAPFDPAQFETKQIFFPSKDGKAKVPMFVSSKKGLALDGSHPTVITGYGFGGISSSPYYSAYDIAWMEKGGISVLVNIRGGGEYGEDWHRAAWHQNRQTGFDDFIGAGEYLIAHKYTSKEHLGAIGTSGGGMLVGAVTDQRPDLWGATVPIAGVQDLLRFHLFGQGAGWSGDLGSPDKADEHKFLYSISPLHNVKPGTTYPAMLVITADHDVRVPPLHSYKYAAALQAAQAGDKPILLRTETQTGHGAGGSTLQQRADQQTEILAFFAKTLGLQLN